MKETTSTVGGSTDAGVVAVGGEGGEGADGDEQMQMQMQREEDTMNLVEIAIAIDGTTTTTITTATTTTTTTTTSDNTTSTSTDVTTSTSTRATTTSSISTNQSATTSDSQSAGVHSTALTAPNNTCTTTTCSSSSSKNNDNDNDNDNDNENDKSSSVSIPEADDFKTTNANINANFEKQAIVADALNTVNTALATAISAKQAQGENATLVATAAAATGPINCNGKSEKRPHFFPDKEPSRSRTQDAPPSGGIDNQNQGDNDNQNQNQNQGVLPGAFWHDERTTLPRPEPEDPMMQQQQQQQQQPPNNIENPPPQAPQPNDGFPVAMPVDDVVEIREYNMVEPPRQPRQTMRWLWPVAMLVAVMLGIVLAILLPPWEKNQVENNNLHPPPKACIKSLLPTEDYIKQCLLPKDTISVMEQDQNSPQGLAFQWLIDDPHLDSYLDWRIQQRYALATFYYATDGDNWVSKKGWLNHTVHECKWEDYTDKQMLGVKTLILEVYAHDVELIPIVLETLDSLIHDSPCGNESESQDGIYLHTWQSNNKLKGTLPQEFFLLTNLRSLMLAFSDIDGTVPSQIGQLTSLEQLVTWRVGLKGTIPTEVGMLSNLSVMVDFTSFLSGAIPSEIQHLTNLKVMSIMENQLTGVPTEIGRLPKLTAMDLGKNRLFTVPTELGQLTSLTALGLYSNELQDFPSVIFSLTSLETLGMWSNPFLATTIPTDVGILTNLKQLLLQDNALIGSLPSEIGLLSSLKHLRIGDNQLSGEIPEELFDLATSDSIVNLNIAGNILLEGTIPEHVCDAGVFLFHCTSRLCGCACKCPALNETV